MKNTQTYEKEYECVISISCDCCKKEYRDILDMQEFTHIDAIGGYNSAIGDEVRYQCDLCSRCVNGLLGKHLRLSESTLNGKTL